MDEKNSLFRSTSFVSINRIISSILGFARDMIWARIFGATGDFDAFVIGFHLPSFISYVISEAGLTQAVTPVLAENQIKKNINALKLFISHVTALLLLGLIIVVIFSIIFSPTIIKLFAPGFTNTGARQLLTISLFRIMASGILFTTLAALCSAILNTFGSYSIPSSMPIIFNCLIITAAIFLTTFFKTPIYAIAWAILFSGIMQLLLQLPFIYKKNLLVTPCFSLKDPDIRKVVKLMLPALLGVSVMQAGVFLDFIFSSKLPEGSVTWLYYSSRLMELPVGVFAAGIATVVLPNLARSHAKNDDENFNKSLNWAIQISLFISIPGSIGLFMLAGPIVATLFGHGLFTSHDIIMTEKSTRAFAIGIVGFMLTRICASGFYAKQNTKLPVKIAIITVLLNAALNVLFIGRLVHAGLALATSLSGLVNGAILLLLLIAKKYYRPNPDSLNHAAKTLLSTLIMTVTLFFITPDFHYWLIEGLKWQIEHLSVELFTGMITYIFVLHLFKFRFNMFRVEYVKAIMIE